MVIKLLPLTLAVFIGFLVIGMQLPVLPLHLHDTLGMDTLVVGLVVGSQFAAALLSRSWAGNYADMRGAKRAVVRARWPPPPRACSIWPRWPFLTRRPRRCGSWWPAASCWPWAKA